MKKNATPGQIAKIVEKLANGRISGRTAQAIIEGRFTVDGDSPLPATIVYLESDLLKRPKEVLAELDRKGLIPARKVDIDADPDTKGLYDIGRLLECWLDIEESGIFHTLYYVDNMNGTSTHLDVRIRKERA